MKRSIIACMLAASTILVAVPALTTSAQADPVSVSVSGKLRKGPICSATDGTGNVHGKVTITSHGNGDPNLRDVEVTGFVKKIGMRKLWNVFLRQVTGDGNIDTQIGFAWTGAKTRGKFNFSDTYALDTGSYQLQVLFARAGTPDTPADKNPFGCPGIDPNSYKTPVLALDVP